MFKIRFKTLKKFGQGLEQEITFFFYQLLKLVVWTLHLYMRYEINNKNVSVWIHNNKMTCVYLAVSVSESVSLLYAVKP